MRRNNLTLAPKIAGLGYPSFCSLLTQIGLALTFHRTKMVHKWSGREKKENTIFSSLLAIGTRT
jgi:hypothetical protein